MYVVDITCFSLIVIIFVINLLRFWWKSMTKDIGRVIGMRRIIGRMLRVIYRRIIKILSAQIIQISWITKILTIPFTIAMEYQNGYFIPQTAWNTFVAACPKDL